jgi:hypothetical protein
MIALAAATALVLGAAGAATADSSDAETFGPGPMCCSG